MTKFKQCPFCELEWQNDLEEGPHFDHNGEPIIDESFACISCDSNCIYSKEDYEEHLREERRSAPPINLDEFQRCMNFLR